MHLVRLAGLAALQHARISDSSTLLPSFVLTVVHDTYRLTVVFPVFRKIVDKGWYKFRRLQMSKRRVRMFSTLSNAPGSTLIRPRFVRRGA